MKRKLYIDLTKGFLIILMLFTHTSLNDTINTWVFSFHMPLFFIICGVLLFRKTIPVRKEEILSHIKKRIIQLGIPYIVFGLTLTAFYTCLKVIAGQETHVWEYIKRIVLLQGIDSLWFLPVYFFAELIMVCLLCFRKGRRLSLVLATSIIIALCFVSSWEPTVLLYRLVMKIIIGFVFVYLGYEMAQLDLLNKIPIYVIPVMLVGGAVLSYINGFSAIG